MDFSKYEFRCSQLSKITGGTIGTTEKETDEMVALSTRKMKSAMGEKDEKGKEIKPLTDNMETRLKELVEKKKDKTIPKTMQSELRKIFRMEKYNRNFPFTNQYIQKGIQQEEEAITVYQDFRNKEGIKTLFSKNTVRLRNGWVSGEPDLLDNKDIKKCEEGFDTKCSWSLETFAFEEDDLDPAYETQNQGYMWLTGAKKWTTAYILVNATEHQVFNEKQKWFYALQCPGDANDKYWDDYVEKCREVEKMMIYDYDRFIYSNPNHNMEISKDEWFGEGYDIPLEERIVEKTSIFNPDLIEFYKERIVIGREYMDKLLKT